MKKTYYKHIGYYEQAGDIKELGQKSADEIVNYYKKGYGAFYSADDADEPIVIEGESENVTKDIFKLTTDNKYLVVDETAYFLKPIEYLESLADAEDGDSTETYIDIYEACEDKDVEEIKKKQEYGIVAREIVNKLLDWHMIEDEPTADSTTYEIEQILKKHF